MTRPWLFALGVAMLIALVSFTTLRSGQLLRRWKPPFNLLLSLPDNLARLLLIGLAAGLGLALGPGPEALGWGLRGFLPDVLLGVLVALLVAPFVMWAGQLAVRRWGPDIFDTTVLRAVLPVNQREWVGVLLALLPAAALEELLFRSLLLGGLAPFVEPWWLMWPVAILFGLLHWPQGAWGIVGATLLSIILSLLFLVTEGVWAPLAAHYLLNALQIGFARRSGYRPLRY